MSGLIPKNKNATPPDYIYAHHFTVIFFPFSAIAFHVTKSGIYTGAQHDKKSLVFLWNLIFLNHKGVSMGILGEGFGYHRIRGIGNQ